MLFFKKLSYKLSKLFSRLRFININWGSMFTSFILLLFITVLAINNYNAFVKGAETMESFQQEQEKLDQLRNMNADLQNQVEHFDSLEYKKIYARENLNLGDKNETLYYVDRPKTGLEIEELPVVVQEVTLQDNFSYWKKLILGL